MLRPFSAVFCGLEEGCFEGNRALPEESESGSNVEMDCTEETEGRKTSEKAVVIQDRDSLKNVF